MPPVYSINAQSTILGMLEDDVKRVFVETATNTPIFYGLELIGFDRMYFGKADSAIIYNIKKAGHASVINRAGSWLRNYSGVGF